MDQKVSLSFPKSERLRHRILIENLFKEGDSFYEFPFRVIWRKVDYSLLNKNFRHGIPDGIGKLQFMVSVPKKKRKRAVDRVLLRRRVRESYRRNRLKLRNIIEQSDLATFNMALIYIHDKNLDYSFIESKMISILEKLSSKL